MKEPVDSLPVYIIATQHLDVAWLWQRTPLGEELMRRGLQAAVDMIEADASGRFVFSRSTIWGFEIVEKNDPALFRKVQTYVTEGRIEVCGGEWVEPDHMIPDGESLVRQMLYGQRYLLEKFGTSARVCWDPDIFAHPGTLPKLLLGCGLDSFYSHRCRPTDSNGHVLHEFRWRGDDGSQVLFLGGHWIGAPDGDALAAPRADAASRAVPVAHVATGLFSDRRITMRREWIDLPYLDSVGGRWARASDVAEVLHADTNLPVVSGELGFQFTGTYTTHHGIKREHRRLEALASAAEKAAVLAWCGGSPYPAAQIRTAWKDICVNEFHDIICGTCFEEAHTEALELFAAAERRCRWVLDEAVGAGETPPDSNAEDDPESVLVFNSLSWSRDEPVIVEGATAIEPAPGTSTTSQAIELPGGMPAVAFLAGEIPGIGYTRLPIRSVTPSAWTLGRPSVDAESADENKTETDFHMENAFVAVEVSKSGVLSRFFDKRAGREVLRAGGAGNRFVFRPEEPLDASADIHTMEPWYLTPVDRALAADVTVRRTENGPLREVVAVTYTAALAPDMEPTELTVYIVLWSHEPVVRFEVFGDWNARRVLLSAEFDFAVDCAQVVCDAPYGTVTRSVVHESAVSTASDTAAEDAAVARAAGSDTPAREPDRPMQKWLYFGDGNYGVGVVNDCIHGYGVVDGSLRLSLLRAPVMRPERDEVIGLGKVHMRYALVLGERNGPSGKLPTIAYQMNHPLLVRYPGRNAAPAGFVTSTPAAVMVTALKQSESGDGVVIRLYESAGQDSVCRVTLPWTARGVRDVDMIERPAAPPRESPAMLTPDASGFELALGPYEVRTLLVER